MQSSQVPLKNIIAIGSGILDGLGLGKNMQALLDHERLDGNDSSWESRLEHLPRAFLGTAGIGDLVCTDYQFQNSRNYYIWLSFWLKAKARIEEILESMPEVAEGVQYFEDYQAPC